MQTRQFPWEYQMDAKDCGPACIKMIAKYYGKYYSLQYLRDLCGITREGVSFLDISYAAEKIGLRTVAVKATMENLTNRIPLPCIIHWDQQHFIVVYKTKRGRYMCPILPKACFPTRKKISKTDGIRKGKNSGC